VRRVPARPAWCSRPGGDARLAVPAGNQQARHSSRVDEAGTSGIRTGATGYLQAQTRPFPPHDASVLSVIHGRTGGSQAAWSGSSSALGGAPFRCLQILARERRTDRGMVSAGSVAFPGACPGTRRLIEIPSLRAILRRVMVET